MKKITIALAILVLAGCSDQDQKSIETAKKPKLHPEQIVQFNGGFACFTKEAFEKAVGHAVNKEKTKFEAMFNRSDCMALPEKTDFKVLSVDRHAGYDLIEITNAKNTNSAEGMWTNWDY